MRSAHHIAMQVVAKYVGIAPLHAARHRLAHERERLVTIESAQLGHFPVEFEALIGELRLAEPETAGVCVDDIFSAKQLHPSRVEIAVLEVPQLDIRKLLEMYRLGRRLGVCASLPSFEYALGPFADYLLTIKQLDCDGERLTRGCGILYEALDIDRGVSAQNLFRPDKNIFDEAFRHDPERYLAVNAAKGEIVDLVAEGGDIRALRRVHIHGQNVFPIPSDMRRELK